MTSHQFDRTVELVAVLLIPVLLSPFAIGGAIGASARARGFIARHSPACTTIGWSALLLALPAATALDGARRVAALGVLCPLIALGFWHRAGGGGDGGDGDDGADPALPLPPEIDWERFMRELDEYAASRR